MCVRGTVDYVEERFDRWGSVFFVLLGVGILEDGVLVLESEY